MDSIRYITNTAAPLPPAFIPRLKALFPKAKLFSMYGLTECKRVSYLPPDLIDEKPDSVGIPMPNLEVFVVDENGNFKDRNATGELVIRSSTVMQGYWNDPKGTAEILKPGRFPWEKVLYSGDIFRIDAEGYLYFITRKDDIIKVRGEKVSPKEIENVLYQLEDIVEARIIPIPDIILGNAIRAELVLRDNSKLSKEDIFRHCRENLEEFMIPGQLDFVDKLPKSDSGKILRKNVILSKERK